MKQYKYKINGNLYNVSVADVEDNKAHVEVNGTPYEIELDKPLPSTKSKPAMPAPTPSIKKTTPIAPVASNSGSSKTGVKSPLPGVIKDIKVQVGDEVKKGQTIVILEAMKMENNINSDKDGKVTEIKVNKGDSVLEGADLIIIE